MLPGSVGLSLVSLLVLGLLLCVLRRLGRVGLLSCVGLLLLLHVHLRLRCRHLLLDDHRGAHGCTADAQLRVSEEWEAGLSARCCSLSDS